MMLKAPFPYAGGKSRVAELCWQAFGPRVPRYVELCGGSLAMLLGRPGGAGKYETVNDASGLIANTWRAIKLDPETTAHHADNPPCELDLLARAKMLREWSDGLTERLASDPEWCDAKAAGWWLWCQSHAIAPDWIRSNSPGLNTGNRCGISNLKNRGRAREVLTTLAERLRETAITCGDWSRLTSDSSLGFHARGTTPAAVFADPPYPDETIDYGACANVAQDMAQWCLEHGNDPRLRIALCGHVDDYDLPGWRVVNWGGSRGHGRTRRGTNECIWFSPHCLQGEQRSLFNGTGT